MENCRRLCKKKLEASWKKVKKMIDETSDQDTKNELYESFIEHKAEMLEHLKVSKSLYDSKKYNTINEFQKKVEVYMNAREKMIASNAERNEAYAKEQERIANEWLKFLLNNYK